MLDNAQNEVLSTLETLNTALVKGDVLAIASCFETDGYWRDLLVFTWNINTVQGKDEITKMLASQLTYVAPLALQLDA